MVEKKQGKIINISSVWGVSGASCEVAYSATKGGITAFTKALGPWLLYTWSGYAVSRDANVAYAAQTDSTLNKILMIYTIIPAVFVVLQAVPIFFYDMVGEKKERITRELMERREAAGLVAGEGEETADAAAAE